MLSIRHITFISTILCGFLSSGASAKDEVLFDCPYLMDESKRSFEALSQAKDGWFYRNSDLKLDFEASPATLNFFKRLNSELEQQDIELVLLPLLPRALMSIGKINYETSLQKVYDYKFALNSYKEFVSSLNDQGVLALDLYEKNKDLYTSNPELFNFKRDIHWKPEGAGLVAELVADELKKIDGYDLFPKVNVSLEEDAVIAREGFIVQELRKLCESDIPGENYLTYKRKQTIEKSADALFGVGEEPAPIHLVGTSFTAETANSNYNFSSHVEAFSKLEVGNFAIPGGGMFTSIISYLSSPFYHTNKPKILLWETQAIYGINTGVERYFRQVIPAIYGQCEGENLIAEGTVSVTDDKSYTLLSDLADKGIGGTDYYLYLYSDNAEFNTFVLELEYADTDGEWLPIDRSDRYNHKGHYYVELSDLIDSDLSHIMLRETHDIKTNIDAKICKKPAKRT